VTSIADDRGFNQGFSWTRTQSERIRRRAEAILEVIPQQSRHRILELGCGTGELASFLAKDEGVRVTGVDLCRPFVEQAEKRFAHQRLAFVQADLGQAADRERLGGGWSALVGNGILHHLSHRIDEALPSFLSMLEPQGRFVFWEPNLFNPYIFVTFRVQALRRLTKLEPDEMAFTPRWISERLLAAGFSDVSVRCRDFLLPVVPFALVPAVVAVGDVAERLPGVDHLAQSLFITARRPS
jgi:SAM-dependent methyltransferase